MKRLVLFDAHSILYRSFFAFIRKPLRNSKGENTSAVFGFNNTLKKVLRDLQPDYSAVVFDAPGITFRERQYAEYKAQRPKTPDELARSIPVVKDLVRALGLRYLEVPGVEADDVIGTLARRAKEEGLEAVIVSSDKDMLQLVDEGVVVYDPWKERFYQAEDVKEKLGVTPEQVPDFLALAGDAVDNVPGVPGIGPKRALALLVKYRTLDEALAREERLRPYENLARLSRDLVVINTRAPVEVEMEMLRPGEPDKEALGKIYRQLEFHSLLRELAGENGQKKAEERVLMVAEYDSARLAQLFKSKAIGFAFEPEKGLWVSLDGNEVMLVPAKEKGVLARVLAEGQFVLVGFDIKEELKELHRAGFNPQGRLFDTIVGTWLIDPNRKGFSPEDVVAQVLDRTVEIKEGAERAIWALRVYQALLPEIAARGLGAVCEELEMPLIYVLTRMEERGVKIDPDYFRFLNEELLREQREIEKRVWQLAGVEFNIGSPKQLAEVLFNRLKLPKGKRTKTGFSTSSDVLEDLIDAHPIVREVLRYREIDKLCNTYLSPLPALADEKTHRLHTRFNQWGTSTGRLSSSEPNLQNIPIRGEEGRRIRKGFVADKGMLFISADYSQIELRVLAHFTGDERLTAAFVRGEDIHAATAAAILGIPLSVVTPEHRRIAKMVNYGLIYGMGDWGLSSRMDIPIEEARAFTQEYFLKFPGVAKWREEITEQARRDGYVRTIAGRIRPVPGILSDNRQQAEMALRAALNAPMQGSSADIMKRAMLNVEAKLNQAGFSGGIILQIHDELLLEVEESRIDEAKEIVRMEMENAWKLRVPLVVEIGVGRNWGEAH
ncbi:MAG: DNA polymerase I [candidate division WOR-3 bacterium]